VSDKPIILPYSRKIMREIILGHDLMVGSRVLHAGCGDGVLTAYLSDLSIDVVGIDESSAQIKIAKQRNPQIPFYTVQQQQIIPLPSSSFDQVIVENSGDSLSGFWHAQLLSCLRPGGTLIGLQKIRPESASQLKIPSYFPGKRSEKIISPGIFNRWFSTVYNCNTKITSLRIPAKTISRKEWLDLVEPIRERHTAISAAA